MSSRSSPATTPQGRNDVFAMSLREVGHTGPERSNEAADPVRRFRRTRFSNVKKRLQRQADDVRVLASKSSRRLAKRLAQIGRQAHGHLILHGSNLPCKTIVMQSHASTPPARVTRAGLKGPRYGTIAARCSVLHDEP